MGLYVKTIDALRSSNTVNFAKTMNIAKTVENIPTLLELKRIAGAYVIDYRNLSEKALRSALIKTAPQYYFEENVQRTLENCLLYNDRDIRTLTPIFVNTFSYKKMILSVREIRSTRRL